MASKADRQERTARLFAVLHERYQGQRWGKTMVLDEVTPVDATGRKLRVRYQLDGQEGDAVGWDNVLDGWDDLSIDEAASLWAAITYANLLEASDSGRPPFQKLTGSQ